MKRTIYALAITLLLPLLATAHDNDAAISSLNTALPDAGMSTSNGNTEASKALNAFHQALKNGDGAAAMALLSADVVIFESGFAQSRAEYAKEHLAADMAFAKGTSVNGSELIEHCQPALCIFTQRTLTTGKYKGHPVHSVGVETAVLVQTDGTWRIAHLHWSSRN